MGTRSSYRIIEKYDATSTINDICVIYLHYDGYPKGHPLRICKWLSGSKMSLGYNKVSEEKSAVALKIRDYVIGGGFMFAMCSATDTYDIALAAEGLDICAQMYDGDPEDPDAQS